MKDQVEKKHSKGPHIHLLPIPTLREILWSEVATHPHYFEHPLFPLHELTQLKIVKIGLSPLNPDLFRPQIAVHQLKRVHLLQKLYNPRNELQSLRQWQHMSIATHGQL